MSPLPLPIRLAAGLAAIALERARKLPQDVSEWPMTAVSQALQMSMRVQQRITELAIKGDEALAALREPDEEPPWAVFDEDLPEPSYLRPQAELPQTEEPLPDDYDLGAQGTTTAEERSWFAAIDEVYARPDVDLGADTLANAAEVIPLTGPADAPEVMPVTTPAAETATETAADEHADTGTPAEAANTRPETPAPNGAVLNGAVPNSAAPAVTIAEEIAESGDNAASTAQHDDPNRRTRGDEPPNTDARTGEHAGGVGVPAALPSYPGLSLASVRGRLRVLTAADLEELLAYERGHGDRPEFVQMLQNRIATVRGTR